MTAVAMDAIVLALFGCFVSMEGVQANMDAVTPGNCRSASYGDIYLPQPPRTFPRPQYRDDPSVTQPRDQISLQYAYNTASSRAIFLDCIYTWTNQTYLQFQEQPGLNYLYMSEAANVLAGPDDVTSSGLFFLPKRMYPNWLISISYNQTFPLFAVRASRDPGSNLANIKDLGATPETNYTDRIVYRQNEFSREIAQDERWFRTMQSVVTGVYRIHLLDGDSAGQVIFRGTRPFHSFFGPGPDSRQPAKMVDRPYYDCGQTNRWLVTVEATVTEFLPRYSTWTNLRNYATSAISTVDVDWRLLNQAVPQQTDDNTIAPSTLTQGRQALTSVDGQTCLNTPPPTPTQLNPALWNLAQLKVDYEVQGRAGLRLAHFLSNFLQNNDPADNERHQYLINQAWDKAYNARRQERIRQYRMGNRNWYGGPLEEPEYGSPMWLVKVDRDLTRKQIQSEVVSTVLADGVIMSAGIYLEPGVFSNSTVPVSTLAGRMNLSDDNQYPWYTSAYLRDVYLGGHDFRTDAFYVRAKNAFTPGVSSPSPPVSTYRTTSSVRTRGPSEFTVQDVPGEVQYESVGFEAGQWMTPYFHCDQHHQAWVVSYVAPIFDKDVEGPRPIKFGGVVKVDAYFTEAQLART